MNEDSRTKMVLSAASLIRRRGASATSFSEVLAHSGAPRGSIYHHFPNGKQQLEVDAIRGTSEAVLAVQRSCRATTPAGVLEFFIDRWRQLVVATHGTAGCVVAGVAIDTTPEAEAVMVVVRETFQAWVALLTEQLTAAGLKPSRARSLAVTTLAAMEGALILCRAERSVTPLDTVAAQLRRLV